MLGREQGLRLEGIPAEGLRMEVKVKINKGGEASLWRRFLLCSAPDLAVR